MTYSKLIIASITKYKTDPALLRCLCMSAQRISRCVMPSIPVCNVTTCKDEGDLLAILAELGSNIQEEETL